MLPRAPPILAFLAFLLLPFAQLQGAENSRVSPHQAFFQKYCFECHDSDAHKAGFKLDPLPWEPMDWQQSGTWEKVFDKIDTGQMPPKKAQQPSDAERTTLIAALRRELRDACLARQAADGRVMLRRLNRTEYQNTLEDLLDVHVPVADILPEDGTSAGFDDVADALDISGVHWVRYQQAIDEVLSDIVPSKIPVPTPFVLTAAQLFKERPFFKARKCIMKGDAMLMPWKAPLPGVGFASPPAPRAGYYRFRATAYAYNTHGKPLAAVFSTRDSNFEPLEGRVQAWRDVPPDKPTVIEAVMKLRAHQRGCFFGWELPANEKVINALKDKPGTDWEGPFLAIEKLEV